MNAFFFFLAVVFAIMASAFLALERAVRPGHPLGFPSPTTAIRTARCQRCGRTNLEADAYGRALPHFPHTRAPYLCGFRRIH